MLDARRSILQSPEGKKKEKRVKRRLAEGMVVKSKSSQWIVAEILGSGGFGDVYKVRGGKDNEAHAMKTEFNDPKQKKSSDRLKIEKEVFEEFNRQWDPDKMKHFLKMIDYGMSEGFKWIVMTLVLYSLDDLRHDYLDEMTYTTIYKISLQTLKAIKSLHECGYLHRDIKPHNFAIGIPPKDATIFMIDFGIARRYVEKDGKLRIPRQSVRFLGTVRFASRNCHNEKEQSRRDDLESWCYMILDQFHPDNITWRRVTDRAKVAVYKHQMFTRQDGRTLNAPKEMTKIIEYINGMGFAELPEYEKISDWLVEGAKEQQLDLTKDFVWQGKELKKKPKMRGVAANRVTDDEDDTTPSRREKKEKKRKRFSMENDESSSEDDRPAKPLARKPYNASAMQVPPSAKNRTRTSAVMGAMPKTAYASMLKPAPPPSGVRMNTAIGRDQNSLAWQAKTCSGVGTTGPNSNYTVKVTTAIPRTPASDSLQHPVLSVERVAVRRNIIFDITHVHNEARSKADSEWKNGQLTDEELSSASFLHNSPHSKEALYMRRLFHSHFPSHNAAAAVHKWIPKWQANQDRSGRASLVHISSIAKEMEKEEFRAEA